MIKGIKKSCYGQWKGLKALIEYSHLRASENPEKSRDSIFGNPGIGILKKSWDIVWSRRGLVVGSLRAPSVILETKYDVVKINSNKVPSAHIFCYWKVSNTSFNLQHWYQSNHCYFSLDIWPLWIDPQFCTYRPQMKSSINCLLIGLASFDIVLIITSILMFGLPRWWPI